MGEDVYGLAWGLILELSWCNFTVDIKIWHHLFVWHMLIDSASRERRLKQNSPTCLGALGYAFRTIRPSVRMLSCGRRCRITLCAGLHWVEHCEPGAARVANHVEHADA